MILVEQLKKSFGALRAVDDLSFEVRPGEVLGFLGPNGAGKSTTMKMITGFLRPDGGRVSVCGLDVTAHPLEVSKRIGYLPEGAPCYGDMECGRFLAFIAEVRGFKGAEKAEAISRAVDQMDISGVWGQRINTLSKGFKRRVGLAQALLHNPDVLVLDEPTDGLDPNQKYQVRELIRNLSQDKTVVISTHILEEVGAVCNRAMIIANGQLVADDTPQELAKRASKDDLATPVAAAGVDLLPSLNAVFRKLTSEAAQ